MKRIFDALVLVSLIVLAQVTHAVTVYYQPTPYPMKKKDGTAMPQGDVSIVHTWMGWLPNYFYGQVFQRNAYLQAGGWGDVARTYMKFDLAGLPQGVDQAIVWLMPYSRGDSSTPTPYALCNATSAWNLAMTWNTQPTFGACYGWARAPVAGSWSGFQLSGPGGGPDWYNAWQSGTLANNGLMLMPQANNNNFDVFRSTLFSDYASDPYADAHRPILQLTFTQPIGMPQFKMPLPGGYKWLVTNEIGGYECTGVAPWPDTAHQDAGPNGNYYSIDIAWHNYDNANHLGTLYGQFNTPVLAAASGRISDNPNSGDQHANGNYVVIDHDGDGKISTGYSTRYLHLKDAPHRMNGQLLQTGDHVNQGDQIGVMGTTGHFNGLATSTGVHVHFGIRFNDRAYGSNDPSRGVVATNELTKVLMEGLLLKSYQTECAVNANGVPTGAIRYYPSSNIPTGM